MLTEKKLKKYIESKNGIFKEMTIKKHGKRNYKYANYICQNNHKNCKKIHVVLVFWCRECTKNTIEDAEKLAEKNDGEFLSKKYINAQTKYKWKCKNNHIFKTTYHTIRNGTWCPECNSKQKSLDHLKKLAKKRGGKCLATEYKTMNDKYKWKCKVGHTWKTTGNSIRDGSWCKECSETIGERTCVRIMEFIYGKSFKKCRPKWLVSKKKTRLEFDGYNKKLKIAIEYNGIQHYKFIKYFHKNKKTFKKNIKTDKRKIKLCKKKKVKLIVVPYTVKYEDLYAYIRKQCVNLPKNTPKKINYRLLDVKSFGEDKLKEVKKYTKKHFSGKILSDTYISCTTKLSCKCVRGHKFKKTWALIKTKNKPFCLECSQQDIITEKIKKIKKECKKLGMTPLNLDDYKTTKIPLEFKCNKCDYIINRAWGTLKQCGFTCSQCSNK